MWLLDFLQNLPLAAMFLVALAIGFALCVVILSVVRVAVRMSGLNPVVQLPVRDTIIGAVSTIFALMMAFSAAGIWNDTLLANSAVQREANAIENALALARGLPADLTEKIRDGVVRYSRLVVERDWPAMARRTGVNSPAYEESDRELIGLINVLAREPERTASLPTIAPLLGQIAEARNARLARLTLANAGVSVAQWLAMVLIASTALTAVALCHNHHFGMQVVAMGLYTLVASSAFFVILAHDRPFVGVISVSPAPIQHLAAPH